MARNGSCGCAGCMQGARMPEATCRVVPERGRRKRRRTRPPRPVVRPPVAPPVLGASGSLTGLVTVGSATKGGAKVPPPLPSSMSSAAAAGVPMAPMSASARSSGRPARSMDAVAMRKLTKGRL